MDPHLRDIIESELDSLGHDPDRGSGLEWNLAGLRSIHMGELSYRIVYKADHASCTATVIAISHRGCIYDDLARMYQGPQDMAGSESVFSPELLGGGEGERRRRRRRKEGR